MVDVFEQIYNQLNADLTAFANTSQGKTILGNRPITLKTSYQRNNTAFPYVTIEEKNNRNAGVETDSWEKFSFITYEINIYDNSANMIKVCRSLAMQCDLSLSRKIGLKRTFQDAIPNLLDANIYRIIQRRDGFIDNELGVVYMYQP